jgi:uncharacterized repeat protein (TIGR03803 family)
MARSPTRGLVFDQKGNLYGTAAEGGAYNSYGGVVFKLTPNGKETVLHSFCALTNCADGWGPLAGLIFDQKGSRYGTTEAGGAHSYGTVFKLTPKERRQSSTVFVWRATALMEKSLQQS